MLKIYFIIGTDIILSDRKQLLLDQSNISLFQDNCVFISYNSSSKMSKCICPVQTKNSTFNTFYNFFSKSEIILSFYTTLSNSNFHIMKCYKLIFSKAGQSNNIGNYIVISIIEINIILMILCYSFERKK